jgi:hypothetical protein
MKGVLMVDKRPDAYVVNEQVVREKWHNTTNYDFAKWVKEFYDIDFPLQLQFKTVVATLQSLIDRKYLQTVFDADGYAVYSDVAAFVNTLNARQLRELNEPDNVNAKRILAYDLKTAPELTLKQLRNWVGSSDSELSLKVKEALKWNTR